MSFLPALPIFTWGNRPAASAVNIGATIRVIDVGLPCGIVMTSDGVNWLPAGAQVIARVGTAVSVTGSTSEIAVLTVTLPAGFLSPNSAIRASFGASYTNNVNSKTYRLKLGGTSLRASVRNTSISDSFVDLIRNRGLAASQIVQLTQVTGSSAAVGSVATAAVDTSVSVDLVLSIQLAVGTDTATLEQATIEVLP